MHMYECWICLLCCWSFIVAFAVFDSIFIWARNIFFFSHLVLKSNHYQPLFLYTFYHYFVIIISTAANSIFLFEFSFLASLSCSCSRSFFFFTLFNHFLSVFDVIFFNSMLLMNHFFIVNNFPLIKTWRSSDKHVCATVFTLYVSHSKLQHTVL